MPPNLCTYGIDNLKSEYILQFANLPITLLLEWSLISILELSVYTTYTREISLEKVKLQVSSRHSITRN